MPLTTITLTPYAQGNGSNQDSSVDDPPVLVGGGSVSDGSDTSYVEQGAWNSEFSVDHMEPLATYFRTPAGFDPQFLAIQTRWRNDPWLFSLPAVPDGSRQFYTELKSDDGSVMFDVESIGGSTLLDPIMALTMPDSAPGVPNFTWQTWWAQNNTFDPDNPASANGWYRLDWDYSFDEGDKAALTGPGLRLDMGIAFFPTRDLGTRYPWIDYAEVRLVVAGTTAGLQVAPPCHLYPRDDNQGAGSGAIWPPPSSGRPGGYY